jgi:hypothetical protein
VFFDDRRWSCLARGGAYMFYRGTVLRRCPILADALIEKFRAVILSIK